eukprot:918827-Pyramimonas_sp.AAC.1
MTISTPAPTPTPYHQMVTISVPNTCSGYYNRRSGGGGGSHENQCVVLGGGYGGASKEKVKANGVAVG